MSELHRWTQNGIDWACAAYDHGPLCRLCQIVDPNDEVLLALFEHVEEGNMEIFADHEGFFRFKLTPQGTALAINLIHTRGGDPDNAGSVLDVIASMN